MCQLIARVVQDVLLHIVELRGHTPPRVIKRGDRTAPSCTVAVPSAPTKCARKTKKGGVRALHGLWASCQRVRIEMEAGWGARGHLPRTTHPTVEVVRLPSEARFSDRLSYASEQLPVSLIFLLTAVPGIIIINNNSLHQYVIRIGLAHRNLGRVAQKKLRSRSHVSGQISTLSGVRSGTLVIERDEITATVTATA